jgi:hypothetical protein
MVYGTGSAADCSGINYVSQSEMTFRHKLKAEPNSSIAAVRRAQATTVRNPFWFFTGPNTCRDGVHNILLTTWIKILRIILIPTIER